MKKIILFILPFLLFGCYNYMELEDMAVVSLISIDYNNDNFNLILEIRDNKKDDMDSSSFYNGSGKTIDEALQNINQKIDKNLYFVNLDIVTITKEVANKKFDSFFDYFTRDNNIGTNFHLIIDNDFETTKNVIKDKKKVVGSFIKSIIETKYSNVIKTKYNKLFRIFMSPYYDIILPVGKVFDDEYIITSAAIFSDKNIVHTLEFDDIEIYNMLNNFVPNTLKNIIYNNNSVLYKIGSVKTDIKYKNNIFYFNLDINGVFVEMENIDLNDPDEINNILNLLNINFEKQVNVFLDTSKNKNSDILGLKKIIYNKTRKKIKNINNIEFKVNVNTSLNREGLIFNSIGDEYEEYN